MHSAGWGGSNAANAALMHHKWLGDNTSSMSGCKGTYLQQALAESRVLLDHRKLLTSIEDHHGFWNPEQDGGTGSHSQHEGLQLLQTVTLNQVVQ